VNPDFGEGCTPGEPERVANQLHGWGDELQKDFTADWSGVDNLSLFDML